MSNQVYITNKVVYDEFLSLLEKKVTEAENAADFSAVEAYSAVVQQTKHWINTDGSQPDPSDEKMWLEFGLKKPEHFIAATNEPQTNNISELQQLIDRARELITEAANKALIDVESQIRELISGNEDIPREMIEKALVLLGEISEKRKQVARSLLDTLRETKDDETFEKILNDVKQWNPSDQKIAEVIAELEKNHVSALSPERITGLFNALTDKGNIDRFSSSLRYLEGISSRGTIILTSEEKKMIIANRKWLDDYNQKMGVMSSVISFKNLRDIYIEYRKVRDYYNFDTYTIKEEAKTKADAILELGKSLDLASGDEAQKQLDHAKQFFKDSPTRAVNHLKQILNETEIYTFVTSDGNKIEETIKKRPFQEREQQTIRERIEEYNLSVEKEQKAQELVSKADDETDIYQKVSQYLNSRKSYQLPNVAEKIRNYVDAAKKTRLDDIRRELGDVELKIDRLEKLKLDKAKEEVGSIRESINSVRKKILDPWLGVPPNADFLEENERQLITRPGDLDSFEAEINELLKSVSQKDQLIDDLRSSVIEIERLLDEGKTSEAISTYEVISQTEKFDSFSAFVELSQRIAKFRSFDEVVETIQNRFAINDFKGVVEYFYGIQNASAFVSGDPEAKSHITQIVKESRQKFNLSQLKRYLDKRNLRAARWMLDTLRGMDFSDESVDLANREIEQIVKDTQQISQIYSSSFSSLGVRHPSPLTTIFSLIDRYREQINEGSLNERETNEFRSITDSSGNFVEEQKISAEFEKIIEKHDFKQLYSAASKIYYASGSATEQDPSWPRYQESIDTYDAKRIWPIIKSLVKSKISIYCGEVDAQKKEEDPRVGDLVMQAYHDLDLRGEKEFNTQVEALAITKAFCYTEEEKKTQASQSSENVYRYWKKLADYFPQNKVIQDQWSQKKYEYVSIKLRSLSKSKKWIEAQDLLQEHKDLIDRNASLLKLRINYSLDVENPNFSIDLAQLDLNQLSGIPNNDEDIDELNARLEVARIKTRKNITELQVLEGVNQLKEGYQTKKVVIEKEFNTLFTAFIQSHKKEYQDYLEKGNFIDAVMQVVSISRAEEIKGNGFETSKILIDNDSLKKNIPDVAQGLITKVRKLDFLNNADIEGKSQDLEMLLSQLKGVSAMITVRYVSDDIDLPIHQLIGIKTQTGTDGNPVTLAKIEKNITICTEIRREIDGLKEALVHGGSPENWEESAKRIIDGNNQGWSTEIINAQQTIEGLSAKYDFLETTRFLAAFDQWGTSLGLLNKHYKSLRDQIQKENFEECVKIAKSIEECINALEDYSTENNTALKEALKNHFSIPVDTSILRGLPSISSHLEACINQIENLSKSMSRLSGRIESQERETSTFLSNFESFTQLLEQNELKEIKFYQGALQDLKTQLTGPDADQGSVFIPIVSRSNGTPGAAEEPTRESKIGFFASLFGRGRNKKSTGGNPVIRALERDFSNKSVESQKIQLNRMLSSLIANDVAMDLEPILSDRAEVIQGQINQLLIDLDQIKLGIEHSIQKCDELLGVRVKLSTEKAQELIRKNNFLNLALEIKKSDPFFVMDELDNYRKIAINHLTKPGN